MTSSLELCDTDDESSKVARLAQKINKTDSRIGEVDFMSLHDYARILEMHLKCMGEVVVERRQKVWEDVLDREEARRKFIKSEPTATADPKGKWHPQDLLDDTRMDRVAAASTGRN